MPPDSSPKISHGSVPATPISAMSLLGSLKPAGNRSATAWSHVREFAVFEVPPVVRRKALLANADAWLDALPVLVTRLNTNGN